LFVPCAVFPHGEPDGYAMNDEVNFSDCSRGLKVSPRKGNAILWYSLTAKGHMNGELDFASLHAGE
jgi:hypothetical protein